MPRGDTSSFFQFINDQNERMAAREAAEQREEEALGGPDAIQLQRDAERREKWGQLRAREHPSKRPHSARVLSNGSRIGMTPGPD